jgi:DNA-binding NarL/FixJ family response regulator
MYSHCILIIDDHPVVADSVAAVIQSIRSDVRLEICHSLRNAQAFLAKGMLPALIVTDLSLPDSKGIGTVEALMNQISTATGRRDVAKMVVFSGIEHSVLKHQCLALGALAFVTKSEDSKALKRILETCLLSTKLAAPEQDSTKAGGSGNDTAAAAVILTKKQTAIWQDLAAGYSNAEIASRHGVGINTIKTHVKDIFDRIGARNRTEAAKLYFNQSSVADMP